MEPETGSMRRIISAMAARPVDLVRFAPLRFLECELSQVLLELQHRLQEVPGLDR
jgi:hypothetical protein